MAVESSVSVGQAARGIELLEVSAKDWQRVIDDPIRRSIVRSALRGELNVADFDVMARETELVQRYCGFAGINYPGDTVVKKALHEVADRGDLTGHDRFVPAGIGLAEAFTFFNFNNQQAMLKFYHDPGNEWWREDKGVEHLATGAGVIQCDFGTVWLPTDIPGRPFNCDLKMQVAWAHQQGGDGITSAEETLYLFARCFLEFNRPLWGAGWLRCRNRDGYGDSLSVYWDAADGLGVGSWDRDYTAWCMAALPRKFVALGS